MNAKLTVYQVDQCGYYAHGSDTHACCDLKKCLTDINTWIRNQKPTIEKTQTFGADEDGVYLPVYCFDSAGHGKHDFLVTTWNETPSDDGAVGAVARNEVAGSADVKTANLPKNSIPGYGTHFWFLSDRKRLVTVRFESQPLNGHAGLNLYMKGYLERFSPNVRFEDDTDDGNVLVKNVIGYAVDNDADEADDGLRPRFKSRLLRRGSEIAYIKKNRAKIKKVIRKGRPTTGGPVTRTLLDRILTLVGAPSNQRVLPDRNFLFEIAYTPTAQELDGIIEQYQSEAHETWDDVGFDFAEKSETTRRWLSSSTLKLEIDLPDNLRDGAASLASADALLQALQTHRQAVSV